MNLEVKPPVWSWLLRMVIKWTDGIVLEDNQLQYNKSSQPLPSILVLLVS